MALPAPSHSRDLTDEQWVLIGPFLPKLARRTDGRGRPWRENRAVLNGILWILRTGAPWADLPDRYPSYQTCHRRFQQWVRAGVLRGVLEVLAQALHDEGYLDLEETFIDGASRQRSREAPAWARRSAGRARRSWRSPIAADSRSRFTSRVPRRMKSPCSTQPSRSGSSSPSLFVSSVTTPTSRTAWMPTWPVMAWN